jgi:hypothetical protein
MAFVQGGLDKRFPNVEHVATIVPEYMHLLVRAQFKSLDELKGRTINLGDKRSGSREVALKILSFAGLQPGVDFVEKNLVNEELLALPSAKMPDALFTVSSVPSYMVENLVETHGFRVLEIPFPQSLALRYGWAGNGKILAYTYNVLPAVPDKDISTVTVSMYLVANSKADPALIARVLETLFTPSVQSQLRFTIDEKDIAATSSGYPVSAGTAKFLARKDSAFTLETWNKLISIFGLIMSFGGMALVALNWFRGADSNLTQDKEFKGYLDELGGMERTITDMETKGDIDRDRLLALRRRVEDLRGIVPTRIAKAKLKDSGLCDRSLAALFATHARLIDAINRHGAAS